MMGPIRRPPPYPAVTSDYESDSGTIQYHDSHIDEREGYTSLFETYCSDADSIIDEGGGDAASANRFHGEQEGGMRSEELEASFKLRGW